jgi:ATP-dependent Clp protease ATP-binding subunit ClpA
MSSRSGRGVTIDSDLDTLPPEIYEELSREVIGQDEALREVSVALVKHLVGHPGGNILLIGNSGTGKTTLMKAVEAMLARRRDLIGTPLIRINAPGR